MEELIKKLKQITGDINTSLEELTQVAEAIAAKNPEPEVEPEPTPEPEPEPEVTEKPNAPTNIRFSDIDQNSLRVDWDAENTTDRFQIFRRKSGEVSWAIKQHLGTVTTYEDKDLEPSQVYEYLVKAINGHGNTNSEVVTIKTLDSIPEVKPEPEPTPGPEPEPEPEPIPPLYYFQPYRQSGINILYQSEDSKVFEIESPGEHIDSTDFIQEQLNTIPEGTILNPTVINFTGKFWTEGNPGEMTHSGTKAITHFLNKKFCIIRGGEFYTKAPFSGYGGNIGKNDYSHRRHFVFQGCKGILIDNVKIKGSDNTDGELIGSSRELTPDFWWQPFKKGYIQDPYTGEKWQNHTFVPTWYLDERATDLINENAIPEILEAGSSAYYEMLKDLLPENEMVPAPKDNGAIGVGFPAYKSYWEFEHAFDFRNSQNVILQNCTADSVWGDGICLGPGTENIITRDSHLRYTGRQGIAIYNAKYILIDNVWVDHGRRAAIDKEPNNTEGYVIGVEVRNCKLRPMMTVFAALGNGKVDDIYLHHNTYTTSGTFIHCGDSREITRRKNWVVEYNQREGGGHGSPGSGVKFKMVDNIIFRHNKESVGHTQNRLAFKGENCGGFIQVTENNFLNASRIHLHNTLPGAIIDVGRNLPEAENDMVEMRASFAKQYGLEVMQPILEVTYNNE